MQSFQQNRHIIFHALVALKMLVSLIRRLVACSPRIVVDRQTDRQTDTQNDYRNPHCACARRGFMKKKAGVILKRCMYVLVQMYVPVIVNTKAMYM